MNNKTIIEFGLVLYDMKNYADLGGCYPPQSSASTDDTLLDLHNSSYYTQPHPIIAKYIGEKRHEMHILGTFSEL